ncbi:hypothetical protein [Acidithiobacillus sp.]
MTGSAFCGGVAICQAQGHFLSIPSLLPMAAAEMAYNVEKPA